MSGCMSSVLVPLTAFILCGTSTGQSVFNFTCDLSPEEHDKILDEAITKLQKGACMTFLQLMYLYIYILSHLYYR